MRTSLWTLLLILPLFMIGCGGGDAPADEQDEPSFSSNSNTPNNNTPNNDDGDEETPPDGIAGGMQALQDQLQQMQEAVSGNTTTKVVDFEEIQGMLPEEVDGLEFVESEGEQTGTLGMNVSTANARFKGEDGARLKVSITDTGSMRGFAMMGYTWLGVEFNRRSSKGYERTTEYKGYKAFQKFEERSNGSTDAELHFLVGERFIVELEGTNVSMDQVESAADDIPTGKLEALKDVGVEEK